jgi:integration host factor subunit beta
MTKSDLINHVSRQRNIPAARAESIVNAIFDSIETTLQRGERIEIRGFGSFEIRRYRAYAGRNPRNGARVEVAAKNLPFFKVGKEMKDRINQGRRVAQPSVPGGPPHHAPGAPAARPAPANPTASLLGDAPTAQP